MKSPTIRVLLVAVGFGALVLSNVACGDSGNPTDGGGATGGKTGTDAAVTHRLLDSFTTSGLAGYSLNDYPDTTSVNLAGNYNPDGGAPDADADGGAVAPKPTLEWDGTDGSPDPGALKVTVTFTDYKQYVDVIKQVSPALDLSGRVLKAQVKLVSAPATTGFPGGLQFHASAGMAYTYFGNAGLTFGTMGTWAPIRLDLGATSVPFDPTMIVQLGVQVYSGDMVAGMTTSPFPMTVVFEIDTISD